MKPATFILNLILAFLLMSHSVMAQKDKDHPNVIFFAVDDLNDWINPLGHTQANTPNLDRLAEQGVVFTNAHAPGAFCAPSRTAIWTGLQASTTGCYTTEQFQYDYPDLVSMQLAFKQAGYSAYGVGKLYHHRPGCVDLRGWDAFYSRGKEQRDDGYNTGYHGSDLPYPETFPNSPYYTKTDRVINGGAFLEWAGFPDDMEDEMLEVKRTNWACDIIHQQHDKPFFLALGLYTPHYPNYAPQKYFDMYDVENIEVPGFDESDWDDLPEHVQQRMFHRNKIRKTLVDIGAYKEAVMAYLACVSYADGMLGRVLDALENSSHNDNTVLIFWSDQGYHLGEKGQWGKHTPWHETTKVPLLVAGNGIAKGVEIDATVGLIDLYPTLIDLCGLPKQHKMDGKSFAKMLKNPAGAKDRELLIPYTERGSYSVVNANWRYIHYEKGGEELYNLKEDPEELKNLAGNEKFNSVKKNLQKAAPKVFREPATPKKDLNLVIDGDAFYWEGKNGIKPQMEL
ncbi:MAG: sulfatase [Prolixibacteraceae bacterium]|nr:sulfatase [Prolixibacteraceae bacterium]